MAFRPRLFAPRGALAVLALGLFSVPAPAQIGVALTGVGPINRSMGGAAVAAPLDASGALYWNPATLSGLPRSELEFGSEILYPQTRLSSSVPQGALARLGPPVPLAGTDRGDDGVFLLPSVGLAYRPADSELTYG